MKKTVAIATFLATGAGAVGAFALSNITFKGSDTLKPLTLEFVNPGGLCPGAVGLTYIGGGSGTGETNMVSGAQTVAPMSRFLQGSANGSASVCAPAGTTAEGLVIGLDGVGVFSAVSKGGSVACEGSGSQPCSGGNPGLGVAYNTSVGPLSDGTTYTFQSWKDVLRVLYAGRSNDGSSANCSSPIRNFLASHYSSIFETPSCVSGACPTNGDGSTTALQHIFRRDDSSGTTDVFGQLLGFANANNTGNSFTPYNLGVDSFCNAIHGTGTSTALAVSIYNALPRAPGATAPPAGQSCGTGTCSWQDVVPFDLQDNDPIRRTATGVGSGRGAQEQVAEPDTATGTTAARGTLGLLLPMVDSNVAGADQYGPLLACSGQPISVTAPTVIKISASGRLTAGSATCPNGDDPAGGNCTVPADANGNPNCVAVFSTAVGAPTNPHPANGLNPSTADGRVFNKWRYVFPSAGNPPVAQDNTATATVGVDRPIIGAYYMLHATATMVTGGTPCTQPDMTLQIGCLVQASPCSLGYAGRQADAWNGTAGSVTAASLVNTVPDSTTCVQQFLYPLSRKLYLDTLVGFQNVTGQEQQLALCEANSALATQAINDNNFVPLPSFAPNGAAPYCEDFNEQMLCAASTNVNGCANSGNGWTALPSTTCGNGTKEFGEDCDNGAGNLNGGAVGTCSLACRIN